MFIDTADCVVVLSIERLISDINSLAFYRSQLRTEMTSRKLTKDQNRNIFTHNFYLLSNIGKSFQTFIEIVPNGTNTDFIDRMLYEIHTYIGSIFKLTKEETDSEQFLEEDCSIFMINYKIELTCYMAVSRLSLLIKDHTNRN